MLRPGGRAAIVLPQGKFNNSSLAFIREWILRHARLLAVVGLHGNSFKPHTGTKTSVLFVQKYTEEQLKNIAKIQAKVEANAPDYKSQIEKLLEIYKNELEIAEENIPEEVYELLLEEFSEPENLEEISEDEQNEESEDSSEPLSLEDKLELADEKINEIQKSLLKAKDKLSGLDDEVEALKNKKDSELQISKETFNNEIENLNQQKKSISLKGLSPEEKENAKQEKVNLDLEMKDLRSRRDDEQKRIKEEFSSQEKELKETKIKPQKEKLKKEIKSYDNLLPLAKEEKLLLTNKGKLEILFNSEDSLKKLKDRYIDAEVAKKLDYPIFMAVSEKGGKNNSGDYEYLIDDDGNIVEDLWGNPEINQDLVNHKISRDELLENAESIPDSECCIAEAFVKFAKEQKFDFWNE